MTSLDGLNAVSDLARAWADAWYHLPLVYGDQSGKPLQMAEPFDFVFFQQSFSDTSLGFGGIAGQAFTSATVFVGFREWGQDAVVYVGGRFAYPVAKDDARTPEFWLKVERRHVPYAVDWHRSCDHRFPPNSNRCLRCGRGINVHPSGGPTMADRQGKPKPWPDEMPSVGKKPKPEDDAPTKDIKRPKK